MSLLSLHIAVEKTYIVTQLPVPTPVHVNIGLSCVHEGLYMYMYLLKVLTELMVQNRVSHVL